MPEMYEITQDLKEKLAAHLNVMVLVDAETETVTYPYAVIYFIPGGSFWGAPWSSEPEAHSERVVQVTSAAKYVEAVQHLASDVHRFFFDRNPDGSFVHEILGVGNRRPGAGPPGVEPEGQAGERIYSSAERFVLSMIGD